MCGLISVIFFIVGFFGKSFERMAIAWLLSALFSIADALYSLKDKNNNKK